MSKIVFKKKVSKNGGCLPFLIFYHAPPFRRINELSLYLSTNRKMRSKIKVEGIKLKGGSIQQKFFWISFLERREINLKMKKYE